MKTKMLFYMNVSYNANFYFEKEDADGVFEKIVGDTSSGSGMGMGGRDLSFWFKTAKARDAAYDRLQKAKKNKKLKLPKFRVETDDIED